MRLAKLIEFLRNRLRAMKWACIGVLVLLILADIFVSREHAHTRLSVFLGFGRRSVLSAA